MAHRAVTVSRDGPFPGAEIFFRPVYGLLIMGHGRRQILWFGVTAHPTAGWIANQLTEAWRVAGIKSPRYLIRDRDGARRNCVGFDPSAFEIARRLLAHPGKTHTPNG